MSNPAIHHVFHYIQEQRKLLARLEAFVQKPAFEEWKVRLIQDLGDSEIDTWLGGWLIHPMFGIGECPLDWIEKGRLEDVHQRLLAIHHGVYL